MKSTLAFLAIFSLLVLYSSTVDGRKHPDEYWTKGRNLRMLVPKIRKAMEEKPSEVKSIKGILSIGEFKYRSVGAEAELAEEEELLGTSSEPVGSGGGGGDPKEEEPLGTSSVPIVSGGGIGGGGGDHKGEKPLFLKFYGPKVPLN